MNILNLTFLNIIKKYFVNQSLSTKLRWIFGVFLILDIINLIYFINFFKINHYLPNPFFVNSNDTFMDFYNPLFHSLKGDFYSAYKSLFPPINVFILKFLGMGIDIENYNTPTELRHDNPYLSILVCIFYISIIALIINIGEWKKFKKSDRFLVFLAIVLSAPVIFSLERGNLIFLALAFLALSLHSTNKWKSALYIGLSVNIKPYILVTFFRFINIYKINIKPIFLNLFFCGFIFFIAGLFTDINYISYFKGYIFQDYFIGLTAEGAAALPHNIPSLVYVKYFLPFDYFPYNFWFSFFKVAPLLPLFFLIYLSLTKEINSTESIISGILVLTNFSVNTGGYSLMYLLLLIPYLINSGEYKFMFFIILGIFALPLDIIYIFSTPTESGISYLGNINLPAGVHWFTLGTFVRPLLNFCMLLIFSYHIYKKYNYKDFPIIKNAKI